MCIDLVILKRHVEASDRDVFVAKDIENLFSITRAAVSIAVKRGALPRGDGRRGNAWTWTKGALLSFLNERTRKS
jgi:hypothetical protein